MGGLDRARRTAHGLRSSAHHALVCGGVLGAPDDAQDVPQNVICGLKAFSCGDMCAEHRYWSRGMAPGARIGGDRSSRDGERVALGTSMRTTRHWDYTSV